MKDELLRLPYGMRDVLPGDTEDKRQIEERIRKVFRMWDYQEVETPSCEYVATFGDKAATRNVFKLQDKEGELLLLRPDMTTPIARVVATRMKTKVCRLAYVAQVYRQEQAQEGRSCEFTQAGVELMGAEGPLADSEVIALATRAILETGLKNFTLSVGHVGFITGLAEAAHLSAEDTLALKKALITRNAVALKEIAAHSSPGRAGELIKELLFLQGDKELLKDLCKEDLGLKCQKALGELAAMYELLCWYYQERKVQFDLGLLRDLDYYTGMIFEGYTEGMGYPIIGGGRYDNMMASFGRPMPAVGFAIGVDRLLLALRRSAQGEKKRAKRKLMAYTEGCMDVAITAACGYRAGGTIISIAPYAMTHEEAERFAEEHHYDSLLYFSGQETRHF